MLYKFGIEFFNGSIITLAAKRFALEESGSKEVFDSEVFDPDPKPFTKRTP